MDSPQASCFYLLYSLIFATFVLPTVTPAADSLGTVQYCEFSPNPNDSYQSRFIHLCAFSRVQWKGVLLTELNRLRILFSKQPKSSLKTCVMAFVYFLLCL